MMTKKHMLWGGVVLGVIIVLLVFGNSMQRSYGGNTSLVKNMKTAVSMGGVMQEESFGLDMMAVAQDGEPQRAPSPLIPPEEPRTGGRVTPGVDRLIIKTGNMSVEVEDVRVSIAAVSRFAEERGGFVVSSNVNEDDVAPYGNVTIRIPSELFDEGLGSIKALGKVVSEQVYGEDVTEEYVDLDAQITNLKATEAQFLQIMTRATDIEDILAVQRELSNVRGQIDRIEGRMKYLRDSASYSTITVYLSTDAAQLPIVDDKDKWDPVVVVREAARSLVQFLQGIGDVVIWVVIYSPIWIVLGIIGFIVYRKMKRRSA